MTENTDWNRRREAAESAADLREVMVEILGTSTQDDNHIEAKRHAAAALEGVEDAEEALRMWRDCEEEAVELLGEEPREDDDEMGDDDDTLREHLADLDLDQRADPDTPPEVWLDTAVTGIDMLVEGVDDPLWTEARAALVKYCIDQAIDALDGDDDDLAEIREKYSAQRWAMEDFAEAKEHDHETGDHGEMVGRAGAIASDLSVWVQTYEGEVDARVVKNMREAEESVRSAVRLAGTAGDKE